MNVSILSDFREENLSSILAFSIYAVGKEVGGSGLHTSGILNRDVDQKKLSGLVKKLSWLFWTVHLQNYPNFLFPSEISAIDKLSFSWQN